MEPIILKRNDHPVSREDFSEEALKVLYRLKNKGHKGYLAGGCVRDILLGRKPKDFDVATDATPNEVKRMFSNCRLIGRRFRLAHVNFHGGETIEVATFRALPPSDDNHSCKLVKKQDGLVTRDNEFGTPEEDALRRDFTVNALFYDISNFSIIDYAGGLKDIENRTLRCIGNPDERYIEDPVRMLRAVRFAATLDLTIEEETWDGIVRLAPHMENTSNARLFEELGKWFNCGAAFKCFQLMDQSGLLKEMLPTFGRWVRDEASENDLQWIEKAFNQFDKWKANGVAPDPALQLTLIFHPYYMARLEKYSELPPHEALAQVVRDHQQALMPRVLISQGYMHAMIRILQLQKALQEQNEKRMGSVRPSEFATAFALFKFRAIFLEDDPEITTWWTQHIPEGKHRERHYAKRKRPRKKPRKKGPPPAEA